LCGWELQWSSIAAISFNAMVFLLMVRVQDSQLPRAIIGTLNTLLFFPSGAVYPEQAFPRWLRVIARLDPFTYAVDGLKALLLRGGRTSRNYSGRGRSSRDLNCVSVDLGSLI
jgi:ABC-type polysaccharide/polyol phosphate export permease